MDRELIDRAWRCLPREFREEVKRYYQVLREQYNGREKTKVFRYLFGHHNLTSDAEGEEMLTCEKCKVMKLYNKFQKDGTFTCLYAAGVLDTLFGSKCLPDEEPKPAVPGLRSDATAHFDTIITDSFRDHNRLHLAGMALQGILSNHQMLQNLAELETTSEGVFNQVARVALAYIDALIEAASKPKE